MLLRLITLLALSAVSQTGAATDDPLLLCENAPCRELAKVREPTTGSAPFSSVRYRTGSGLDILLTPGFDTIFTPSKFPAASTLSLLYPDGRALLIQLAPWDYGIDRIYDSFDNIYLTERRGSKIYFFTDAAESREQGSPVQKAFIQNPRLPKEKILILSSVGFELEQIEQMLSTLSTTPTATHH